ncbi:MAG: c-type cytochrome [Bacteriovoracaceae bacterium]
MKMSRIFFFVSLLALVSCSKKEFVEGKYFAGNLYVDAKTLNKGKLIYTEYCMPCHGESGDGNGVAAKGMQVPPRNLKLGIYKFGRVVAGELPHDDDFFKILDEGLHGSAMLPWDMTDGAKHAVVQYIKTFAPDAWEGKDKTLGEKLVAGKDPFGMAHKTAAIELGKEVYHAVAQCQTCHRAYVTKDELNKYSMKYNDEPIEEFEDDLYKIKLQETEHGYLNIPPDFTWHHVRSARTVPEIYVRLLAGVGGTAMPSWKDTLSDQEIWAVSYYVKDLMETKDDQKKRKELLGKLVNQ